MFAPGTRSRRIKLLGAVTGAGLVLAAFGGYKLTHLPGTATPAAAANRVPPVVTKAGLAQRSGVRVTHVSLTGDGGLVDLRYQVLDADKAAAIHDPANPPEVVDEETGVVVDRPFMGHAHGGKFKLGHTYYLIFENPGNLVRRGSRVTVVLGDARIPHVPVK